MRRLRRFAILGAMLIALVIVLFIFIGRSTPKQESYPVAYEAAIRIYADRFGISPAYVASVVFAESSYREEVVSSVNAQGLMQITPDTGEWIALKLGEPYEEGCLLDADTNLRFGCWFLGFLMDRYDGDMSLSSSAYHQGYHEVDRWLQDPAYSADGVTLQTIPSDAARTYVERVLKYYEFYKTIYA